MLQSFSELMMSILEMLMGVVQLEEIDNVCTTSFKYGFCEKLRVCMEKMVRNQG